MIVVYLPVKFEFVFELASGNRNGERQTNGQK